MKIDGHQHFWLPARGDYGWLTPELGPIYRDVLPADLAPHLASAGIDRTIAVQAAATEAETAFLLALAQDCPSIAGVVGWTDFDAADAPARIAALARNPLLVGLRPMIQDIADPDWMLSARVQRALQAMAEAGLVFDALVKPPQLSRLLVLCDRNPGLKIVVDHCAKPFIARGRMQPWAADMAALAERPHVSVKLSGLATEAKLGWTPGDLAPYAAHVLACFGPERLLWGSDWPVLELAGSYDGWIKAAEHLLRDLAADQREAVFGGNARKLYLARRGRV